MEDAALVAVVQGIQELLEHPPGHILLQKHSDTHAYENFTSTRD